MDCAKAKQAIASNTHTNPVNATGSEPNRGMSLPESGAPSTALSPTRLMIPIVELLNENGAS